MVDVHLWDSAGIERRHREGSGGVWPTGALRLFLHQVCELRPLAQTAGLQPADCVSLYSPSVLRVNPSVPACFITGLLVGLICATVTVSGPQPRALPLTEDREATRTARKDGWALKNRRRISFCTVLPSVSHWKRRRDLTRHT